MWGELAVCYLGLGNDQTALDLHRKAKRAEYEGGYIHNYQAMLANIGNVHLLRRHYHSAISHNRRAAMLTREIKRPVSIKMWTYNINLAYAPISAAVNEVHPRVQIRKPA